MKKRRSSDFSRSVQRLGHKKLCRANEIHQNLKVKAVKVLPQKALTVQIDPLNEFLAQLSHHNPHHRRNGLINIGNFVKDNDLQTQSGTLLLRIHKCAIDHNETVRQQYFVLLKRILQTIKVSPKNSANFLPFLNDIGLQLSVIITHTIPAIRNEIVNIFEIYRTYLEPQHFLQLFLRAASTINCDCSDNFGLAVCFVFELYNRCLGTTINQPLEYCLTLFRISDIALAILQMIQNRDTYNDNLKAIFSINLHNSSNNSWEKPLIEAFFKYIELLINLNSTGSKGNLDNAALKRLQCLYSFNQNNVSTISIACICHLIKCLHKVLKILSSVDETTIWDITRLLCYYTQLEYIDNDILCIINEIKFYLLQCSFTIYESSKSIEETNKNHSLSRFVLLCVLPHIQTDIILNLIEVYYDSTNYTIILQELLFKLWGLSNKSNNFYRNALIPVFDIELSKRIKIIENLLKSKNIPYVKLIKIFSNKSLEVAIEDVNKLYYNLFMSVLELYHKIAAHFIALKLKDDTVKAKILRNDYENIFPLSDLNSYSSSSPILTLLIHKPSNTNTNTSETFKNRNFDTDFISLSGTGSEDNNTHFSDSCKSGSIFDDVSNHSMDDSFQEDVGHWSLPEIAESSENTEISSDHVLNDTLNDNSESLISSNSLVSNDTSNSQSSDTRTEVMSEQKELSIRSYFSESPLDYKLAHHENTDNTNLQYNNSNEESFEKDFSSGTEEDLSDGFNSNCQFVKSALNKKNKDVDFKIKAYELPKKKFSSKKPILNTGCTKNTIIKKENGNVEKICQSILSHIIKSQKCFIELCTSHLFQQLNCTESNSQKQKIIKLLIFPENQHFWLNDWVFYIAISIKLNLSTNLEIELIDNFLKILVLINANVRSRELKEMKNKIIINKSLWYFLNLIDSSKASLILLQLITLETLNENLQLRKNILSLPLMTKTAILQLIYASQFENFLLKVLFLKIFTEDSSTQIRDQCKKYMPEINLQCKLYILQLSK